MSSEPSERARRWFSEQVGLPGLSSAVTRAYDAGHTEGEKKGTAVGYLAALREVRNNLDSDSEPRAVVDWLDRRIREAEEDDK